MTAKPPRICYVTPELPTTTGSAARNGTTTLAETTIQAWHLAGAEVDVVWYGTADRLRGAPVSLPGTIHRVPLPPGTLPGLSMWMASREIAAAVAMIDRDRHFDLIETINDEGFVLHTLRRAGPRGRLRVQTTLQQSVDTKRGRATLEERLAERLARAAVRAAGQRVTASTAQAAAIRAELADPSLAMHMLPMGIADPGVAPLAPDPFKVAYIGSLDTRKGIDRLLDALAGMDATATPLSVVVIGADHGARFVGRPWAAHWKAMAGAAAPTVTFTGAISDAELAAQWATLGAIVVPSRWESFSYVCIEAMARGVPVVAADEGSLPETVGDGGLVVDMATPHALQDALRRLAENRSARVALAAQGRARFEACYELTRYGARLAASLPGVNGPRTVLEPGET